MAEAEHHAHDVDRWVKTYIVVFVALLVLTVVTVGASYIHLSMAGTIALALVIATVKGSLVACYFMHLISEKKLIYLVLLLTALFFVVLMLLPTFWAGDPITNR